MINMARHRFDEEECINRCKIRQLTGKDKKLEKKNIEENEKQ